ncbi:MAG: hypothetical protein AB7H80_15440, partial [Candidatus Kapaibacterium sp.]
TTLGRSPQNEFEEELNVAGVGCERCHGPGSEYVQSRVMKDPELMQASGGSPGNLSDCYACHAENPNKQDWACPFQDDTFDAQIAWQEIGHSRAPVELPKDSAVADSLDTPPGN